MQITFELTEQDFVEAYKTHCSRGPSNKWRKAIWFVFLVVFLGAFILWAIANNTSELSSYFPLAILGVGWFVVIRWFQRRSMRKQFRDQPGAHGPRTVTFDGEGAHWRWEGGSSDVTWKHYIRWIEDDKQILLYSSPAYFTMLPKRGLSPEQNCRVAGTVEAEH
jgi:YcxB-like protein